jgi:hypothetical protein
MQADGGEMEPIQTKGIQALDYLQYPCSIMKVPFNILIYFGFDVTSGGRGKFPLSRGHRPVPVGA